MTDVNAIGKGIVADLESDNDEKRDADVRAVSNFLNAQGVPLTDESGKVNPTYVRGVYKTKAVQREFFNQFYADEETEQE